MKSLIIVYSYHHHNTDKVALSFAKILDASIKKPEEVEPDEILEYDLIGFGSGIYSARHHDSLLSFVDHLPAGQTKKAFIFSTAAILGESKTRKDHALLREKLESKGFSIVDEFSCKGFNTNSFLKFFGGMNKGRPNAEDLSRAEQWAEKLKKTFFASD